MNLNNNEKRKFVKDDYDAIAKLYASDKRNMDLYSAYIDDFIKSLSKENKSSSLDVLDVGCASGEFTNYLKSCDLNVVGLDFSKELLSIARERYKDIDFIECDITKFKTTQKFDGIFSKDTLFHLPDEDLIRTLNIFHDILKNDGKMLLILDIPQKEGEEIYDEPLDNNFKLYYNYLSVDKIKTLLIQSGFTIEKIEFINNSDDLYVYAKGIIVLYCSL